MQLLGTNTTSMMLALIAGHLLSGVLVMAYSAGMALKGALRGLLVAKLLQGSAWLGFGLQPISPGLFWILLPNTLLYLGFAMEMGSFLRLCGLDTPQVRRFYRALALICILAFDLAALFLLDQRGRIVLSSFVLTVLLGYPVLKMLLQPQAGALQRTVSLINVLTLLLLFARGVAAMTTLLDFGLQVNSVFNTVMFLTLYVHLFSGSVGFMLMDKQRLDAELTLAATTDGLTGILNRQAFEQQAGQMLRRCEDQGEPVSCLLMDVDNFKQLNDQHGHLAGDAMLHGVAAAVGVLLRRDDLFGRYGGEEFAVLLPGVRADQAMAVAQRLRRAVEDMRELHYEQLRCTISIGVCSLVPGSGTDMRHYYNLSDQALYLAKQGGKNRVVLAGKGGGSRQDRIA